MFKYLLQAIFLLYLHSFLVLGKCLENGEKCNSNITSCCEMCYENTVCIAKNSNYTI